MLYRIGIDGGGSKTLGVLIDDSGTIIGKKETGPSNFLSIGLDQAVKNIETVIYELCREKNLSLSDVLVGIGVAGVGREKDKRIIAEALMGRNFNFVLDSDAYIALMAATEGSDGIAVISGTGSIAFGVKGKVQARAGGWGYLLGDEGSGFYIGRRAMIEACRSFDGRESPSKLTEIVLDYFACDNQDDFVHLIYEQPPIRQQVAGLTKRVSDLANKEKDPLAIRILEDAAKELALAAITVIKKLGLEKEEFPLGLIGGVFKTGDFIIEPFRKMVLEASPRANIGRCIHDPSVGAALMLEPKFSEAALEKLRTLQKG